MKKVLLFFKRFGLVINIFAVVFLLLAYFAPYISPDVFWPLSFFGLAYPLLLFINAVFLIFWLIQRSKNFLLSTLIILIGYGHLTDFVQFKGYKKDKGDGIKILSYNVNYFSHKRKNKNENINNLIGYLKSSSSDIICLQEVSLAKSGTLSVNGIKEVLPNIKHYHLAHSVWFGGPITFSRYPIADHGEIRFTNSSNMVLFSDIKISDSQIIRVYNCHFQSFRIRPDDYTIIESPTSGSNRLKFNEVLELGHKLMSAFSTRAHQARTMAKHIKNSPYPVVICGDFNDTACSYTYRTVLGDLKDAFVESGFGISNSYNGKLPSFRIDFLLHSDSYSSYNYKRDRVPYSDHFPISCVIKKVK